MLLAPMTFFNFARNAFLLWLMYQQRKLDLLVAAIDEDVRRKFWHWHGHAGV